ncbi:putative CheW protein [Gammaproteobacteria bacterium]
MATVLLDLANPEQALGLYLDALLRETPPTAEVASDRALSVPAATNALSRVAIPVPVDATGGAVAVPIRSRDLELRAEPEIKTKSTAAPIPTTIQTPAPASVQIPSVSIPSEPFQTLLFQVAGLTVAVPLVELNGILRYPERLVAVPGLPPWGLGVIRHRDANLIVIDSIELFVPENLLEATRSRSNPRYLVVLGGGRFGLACDSVDQVVSLKPDEVRWRGERGRRPWLAGTVKERLCALLEVPSLVRLLKAGRLED